MAQGVEGVPDQPVFMVRFRRIGQHRFNPVFPALFMAKSIEALGPEIKAWIEGNDFNVDNATVTISIPRLEGEINYGLDGEFSIDPLEF